MRVGEMKRIFEENPYNWCRYGCYRGLNKLADIYDGTPLSEVFYLVVPEWAYYLRRYCRSLSVKTKSLAEAKACEDPEYAYYLRKHCKSLSTKVKELAEAKACESSKGTYYLRRYCKDLSDEVKELAEAKACEDPEWASYLKCFCGDYFKKLGEYLEKDSKAEGVNFLKRKD